MRLFITAPLFLAGLGSAASLVPRANPKANEYPQPNCLNDDGTNRPNWAHKKLCGCVSLDVTDASVFLATSPSQRILAFKNQACNPGTNKEDYLGETGGGCKELDTAFSAGTMQSVLFYVPVICEIGDLLADLAESAKDALKDILMAI